MPNSVETRLTATGTQHDLDRFLGAVAGVPDEGEPMPLRDVILARTEIDFRSPASLGETIAITVTPERVGTKSFDLAYELRVGDRLVVERTEMPALFGSLQRRGYQIIGPTVRDGAIVYDELTSPTDLPIGWTDEQDGGTYRLKRRGDQALFGHNVGPHSWKKFLHPPRVRLWQAERDGGKLRISEEPLDTQKMAFIGVRGCDLHAVTRQDRVFMGGKPVNPAYKSGRENAFNGAGECGRAGKTGLRVSMEHRTKGGGGVWPGRTARSPSAGTICWWTPSDCWCARWQATRWSCSGPPEAAPSRRIRAPREQPL